MNRTQRFWLECLLKVGLQYLKELRELHIAYPLSPNEIDIKMEIFSNYQLKIAYFYNILSAMLKTSYLTFLIKKTLWFAIKTGDLFSARIEAKKFIIYKDLIYHNG